MGNSQKLDGGAMFGSVPQALWSRWITPDERNRIPLNCRAMLVEIDDRKILCEAGIGCFFDPKLKDRFGVQEDNHVLLESLEKLGITPDQITDVILSHLHFDHAGGLLSAYGDGEPRLVFPKAKFFVGKVAWDRALNPHYRDQASFVPVLNQLLKECGRLVVVDGETCGELPKEFSFVYTDGHTPGQMHTVVQCETKKIFFAGDLIPGTAWLHLPVTMGYDRYPEKLIDEKQKLLTEWEKQGNLIFYTHDSSYAASSVCANKGKFQFLNPIKELKHQIF